MTQQIINIGAAPDDGEGDNLRTAFDKVNENFSNVWAQGPVDSNIRIQGNIISTLQVNQDLALSPNGVGNVRLNNNTIPGANNTWFLGSVTNRWRGLYAGNITAGNLSISGIVDLSGDVTVGGNLTVVGNTIQIGNITTDTKTIQLANTATTDAAANGSGITVGANDDIATFLYDSANNVWTTNIGVSVGGPITGTSLAVSSATVYGNIAAINGNFTGNVTANYFTGDGSQLTNIKANVTISNTAPALGNGGVWWNSVDGRAYIKYNSQFIDLSPSLVPDPTTYVGNVVFDDMTIENVGNVLPGTSNTYSLGSAGFQWKDLYVSNNTIYINSVPVALGAGNVLTVNGEALLSNDSNTSITTTGTIAAEILTANTSVNIGTGAIGIDEDNFLVVETLVPGGFRPSNDDMYLLGNISHRWSEVHANVYYGDGSQLTGINVSTNSISDGNSSVAIDGVDGNAVITTNGGGGGVWTFGTDGNLVTPANLVIGPSPAGGSIILQDEASLSVVGAGANSNVVAGWAESTTAPGNIAVVSFNSPFSGAGNVAITTGNNGGTQYDWKFGNDGVLNLPYEGILQSTDDTVTLRTFNTTTGNANSVYLGTSGGLGFFDQEIGANWLEIFRSGTDPQIATTGNLLIRTDSTNTAPTWNFDATGNLSLPANGIISDTANGIGLTVENPPTTIVISGADFVAVNGTYFRDLGEATPTWRPAGYTPGVDSYILFDGEWGIWNPGFGQALYVNTGTITAPLAQWNINPPLGSVPPTGVYTYSNPEWTFDATGNLTIPGSLIVTTGIVGSGASPAPSLSGFSSVSAVSLTASGNVTGNYILGNGAFLTGVATSYGNANVATFLAAYGSNTISTTGNITAGNLIGNISITGNVQGTTANVTLVAGSYSTVFDNTGNLTLPGNTFSVNYANNTPVDVVTRFESFWTVPTGNSTQSFTVTGNNSYQMWVEGNIPNGIIVWNATVSVTNTNVPVIGQQFAWNYEGGGNILMFTSIPAQIIGTAGAISNAQPAVANTNVFSFGINNTSGGNATVRYGWIQIS